MKNMKKILASLVLGISLFTSASFATTTTSATVWGQITSFGPSNSEVRRCSIRITEGSTGIVVGTSNINGFLYYSVNVSPVTVGEIYHWESVCPSNINILPVGPFDFILFDGQVKQVNGSAIYQ